jgi:hypothetical protein
MCVRVQGTFTGTLLEIPPSTDISYTEKGASHAATISQLSDNIFLEIFDFCQKNNDPGPRHVELPEATWDWHILAHVCQRWRQVVFASPLRLNLRILCTHRTPVRKNLDIWPSFPITIEYVISQINGTDERNIVAALGHPARVCAISLRLTNRQLGKMVTVMQEQFPSLRHLFLVAHIPNSVPVSGISCEFLGRSAPCLKTIELYGIPFPALPTLLLSTSELVTLHILKIPQTGYIPPEAMVAALATLTRLRELYIGFRSPASRPVRIHLPPVTRTVLPALTHFKFWGVRDYLEDFVAQIEAPGLDSIVISYFNQLVDFEVPQLWQFIDHSENLNKTMRCAVKFPLDNLVTFTAGPTTHTPKFFGDFPRHIDIRIICEGIDWQVSHIAQALNQISAILSNMVHFAIGAYSVSPEPKGMDDIEWLQLLRPFSSVRTLFVSRQFSGHVSRSLENIPAVMATEILPSLDMLCVEDQPASSIRRFIAARSKSGRPVAIINSRSSFEERVMSYQKPEIP